MPSPMTKGLNIPTGPLALLRCISELKLAPNTANMHSFTSTFYVLALAPILLPSRVAAHPIRIQKSTHITSTAAQIAVTKAEPSYPILFAREIDFTGPEADSTPGVIDNTSNADHLTSIIFDAAIDTEATASPRSTKRTSTSASTIPIVVPLSETYELQLPSSTITSTSNEPTSTPTPSSSSNVVEMPVYVVPAQAAPQMLEQMASISISSDIGTSLNIPDATSLPNLKATTYTSLDASSSTSTESILFNTNIQVLVIALLLITTFGAGSLIYLCWKRCKRAHKETAARAAITDNQITDQEAGLDIKESIEEIADYKRGVAPAGETGPHSRPAQFSDQGWGDYSL
ncbi:3833_t:CDS:2, partial [Acaulospora colombiana]